LGKSRRFWAVLVGLASAACLVTCVACLVVLGLGDLASNFLSSGISVGVGQEAPEFELATLSGDVIRLSQFRGQPTVISFGATWCPDCRKEASSLQSLHEDYPELKVLLVDSQEDSGTVQAFADKYGLTCTIALDDDGKVSKSYRIYAIPSVFFLDSQGVIQARFIGAPTQAQVEGSLIAIGMAP
jgi:peroxiredoxin